MRQAWEVMRPWCALVAGAIAGFAVGFVIVGQWPGGVWVGIGGALAAWLFTRRGLRWIG